ncbi:MAG: response regulator transcription factor [Bacteroidaceae bacterium]|nr:response regulator transcription factor [Bacteroidaceae bacterium]
MNRHSKYKILLIEPSEIVALGFKEIISRSSDFEIMSTLANPTYYTNIKSRPDIVVINPAVVNYNERFDVRSFFCVNGDNVSIVALTNSGYEEGVMRLYDGCINIYDNAQRVIQKLRSAIEETLQNPKNEINELSVRERDILVAVAKGRTNKEIADEFNISVYTVISHRRNISRKLGINSVPGLTVYAIMNKLVDISDFN